MSAFSIWPAAGWNSPTNNPGAYALFLDFSDDAAILTWPPQPGAITYQVFAGPSESSMIPIGPKTLATTVGIPNLNGQVYFFLVLAQMGDKVTTCSQIVVSVGVLALTVTAPTTTSLLVSFPTIPDATGYLFYLDTNGVQSYQSLTAQPQTQGPWVSFVVGSPANTTQYLIQGLLIGSTYTVTGQALFNEVAGPTSNQTINISDLLLIDAFGNHLLVNRSGDRLICNDGTWPALNALYVDGSGDYLAVDGSGNYLSVE